MLLPEWHPQKAILLAWPDRHTDWYTMLDEAQSCYKGIINGLLPYIDVYLICRDKEQLAGHFTNSHHYQLHLIEADYKDTWARDFGPLAVKDVNSEINFLDFGFNGWGQKFEAEADNLLNRELLQQGILPNLTDHHSFILEGGSIETDGLGTVLSTKHCLMAPNRNQPMDLLAIEGYLRKHLDVNRFLWLEDGYLAGDDTDSHIDTLAKFCNETTIAYVQCLDELDEHYHALQAMEDQLKQFRTTDGQPYQLIPLPMAEPIYDNNGHRLPATYANFLILNEAVLMPVYNSSVDKEALSQLQSAFPHRPVVGIDSTALIKQHGSLHCVTMQIPRY